MYDTRDQRDRYRSTMVISHLSTCLVPNFRVDSNVAFRYQYLTIGMKEKMIITIEFEIGLLSLDLEFGHLTGFRFLQLHGTKAFLKFATFGAHGPNSIQNGSWVCFNSPVIFKAVSVNIRKTAEQ